jgi:hypothetical protein
MNRLFASIVGLCFVGLVGCDKGSTSAPSTDPNRPNAERKLTVISPGSQSVTRDKTDEFSVSISRDRFEGPVEIKIENLPEKVELVTKEMTIPADKSSLDVTVKAAPDAPPVEDRDVKVTAKATNQKDMGEAVVTFKMSVKMK